MSTDLRHRLGKQGERIAAEHLNRLGYEIVERNYRTRWGELDLVAYDGTTLAFCEVKTRRLSPTAGPFDSFRKAQRQRLRKMAGDWLINRPNRPHSDLIRFDAIGITIDATGKLVRIDHLEGAF
jgi:putative endonuclease